MAYPTDAATKHLVAMALKTSMGSQEDATACYVLQMPKIRRTLGFHSKNRAPPAKKALQLLR